MPHAEPAPDPEQLTRAVVAAEHREQWLRALVPFPALAATFLARNASDALLLPFVGAVLVALVLLGLLVAASRERTAAGRRLRTVTLALARTDAPRPATPGEAAAAARLLKAGTSATEVGRLRGVYRVGGGASVGGVPVTLAVREWHQRLGIGEIVDVAVIPSVQADPRADVRRVVVGAFGGRLSVDHTGTLPARAVLRAAHGPVALANGSAMDTLTATAADSTMAAATGTAEWVAPERRGARRLWIGLGGVVGVTLVAYVASALVGADRAARRLHDAVAADSLAEVTADSAIARAVREQPPFDSLRAALTPAAYAHDTAFAASVLAEERALQAPA